MAQSISQVEIAQFDADVKQQYQDEMRLRECVRLRTGVIGASYNFPLLGKGVATRRIRGTDVTAMNLQFSQNTALIEDWNAPEYSDIFGQQTVNFDEKKELVSAISSAIGRRLDQIIIDKLDEATQTVVDNNEGWTLAKLRKAQNILNKNAVNMEDRYFVHDADALYYALGTTEVNSSDYNTVKTLVEGQVNTYVGFTFKMIANRDEGGLPLDTSGAYDIRTNFAFQKKAIGLAIGIDMRTEINYVPEKTSWLVNGLFSGGAALIDPLGVVKIKNKEVAIT